MRKSQNDSWVFGVCGGLAEEYGLNANGLRAAFVLAFVLFGAGLIAYLVLAILMK